MTCTTASGVIVGSCALGPSEDTAGTQYTTVCAQHGLNVDVEYAAYSIVFVLAHLPETDFEQRNFV